MGSEKSLLFVGLVCAVTLRSVSPGPVMKCSTSESKCLKQSTQAFLPIFAAGIPEFNVQSLDPLHLDSVDASSPNLSLKIKDMVVTGLKNCIAKKIELNENKLTTKLLCNVRVEGHYEMNGQLLVLPMKGEGRSHVVLNKIQMNVDSDLVMKTGKDGKKRWHIKNSSYTFQLKDKSHVHFENLFSSNELLAKAAEDIIANNGNEIIVEVGPPVIKAIVDKIVENINHFFKAVPADELALD